MRRLVKQAGVTGLCVIGIHCVFAPSAYAYLDPGTGSMILQGILGALAAGAVFAKIYWQRLMGLFGTNKKGSEQVSEYSQSREDNSSQK